MSGKVSAVVLLGLGMGLAMNALGQTTPVRATDPRSASARKSVKHAASKVPAQPAPAATPEPQAPPQPVVPPRPYEMAPVAPSVTYRDGQLTIVAPNSTLSSVLTAVKARTGAQVDMPGDTANDRVAVALGPGSPREVLSSLLEGSRFDYIVLGSADNPQEITQLILTARQGGGGSAPGSVASRPGVPQNSPPQQIDRMAGGAGRPEINSDDDDQPDPPQPVAEEAPQPVPQPNAPPAAVPTTPSGVPPFGQQPGFGQPGQVQGQPVTPDGQNQPQVKTPEQMLQELQRMQQMQQQQQQQQRPQD